MAESHRAAFASLGLSSTEAITRHFFGELPQGRNGVKVVKRTLPGSGETISVFCKQYSFARGSWKFIGRASKARCEFASYEVFSQLGIPCAEPVAFGEERDLLGRLKWAFIITREIPESQTLVDFFRNGSVGRDVRKVLITQIAEMTQRIHRANFFHHDLVWRNILVTQKPAPKLWWIDCPRGRYDRWSPLKYRRLLKDLASLDKLASQFCSRSERLRFLKIYLGKDKLDGGAKKVARDALNYRKKRWPEDWIEPNC